VEVDRTQAWRQHYRAMCPTQGCPERGPLWADPLKAWGDVLVRQSRIKEALLKYDEALMYAPNWATLKTACEALAHKSKSAT